MSIRDCKVEAGTFRIPAFLQFLGFLPVLFTSFSHYF
uniref:Uncharacterized protein n=1 Tax=Anguilla anguilla TaxID=7936 RepID=A0A0E9RHU1_ANGAN